MSKRIALAAATLVIAVLLLFVYPHRTDAQTTEAKARTPEELSRYIDQMGISYRVGDSYGKAQKYLTQADVPALITMLSDPLQSKKWGDVTELLGYIDKEEESVDALIAFIYRGEEWGDLPYPRPEATMRLKVSAISKLGFIGGDTATDALRELLTGEGANQFLSAWCHDVIEATSISSSSVRGRAALGLVYTRETANVQLVEQLYQSVLPQVRLIDQRPGMGSYFVKQKTNEERQLCIKYSHWLTALAARDYIESEGMEAWISALNFAPFNHGHLPLDFRKYDEDLNK